jgi:hypothetical protein
MEGLLCSCDIDDRSECGFHMTIDQLDALRAAGAKEPT